MRRVIVGIVVVLIIAVVAIVVFQQQAANTAAQAKLSEACVSVTGEARSACDEFARLIVLTPDANAAQCAYDYDDAEAIFRCMGLGIKP